MNPARVIPFQKPEWIRLLLQLSPIGLEGEIYPHYDGPVTRNDEVRLQVLLTDLWPGIPTTAVHLRSRSQLTLGNVKRAFELALEGTYLQHYEDEPNDDLLLSTFNTGTILLHFRRSQLNERPDARLTTHELFLGPGVDGDREPIYLQVDVEWERRTFSMCVGSEVNGDDLLTWLRLHLDQAGMPLYAYHGLRLLRNVTLSGHRLRRGQTYEISVAMGIEPSWIIQPSTRTIQPNQTNKPVPPAHRSISLDSGNQRCIFGDVYIGTGHGIVRGNIGQVPAQSNSVRLQLRGPVTGFWTLILSPRSPLSTVTNYLEYTYGRTFRYLKNEKEINPNYPSPHLRDGDTLDAVSYQHYLEEDTPERTSLDPNALRLIQKGALTTLPPPPPGYVKLRLEGEKIGTWTATIKTTASFSLIANHLNQAYGETFRFAIDGQRILERMTVYQNDLDNMDEIDVLSEQTGGGPSVDDNEFDRYSETRGEHDQAPVNQQATSPTILSSLSRPPMSASLQETSPQPAGRRYGMVSTKGTIDAVGKFEGRNAKAFLRKFEALDISDEERLKYLSFYVEDKDPDIFSLIEAHSSYIAGNWTAVRHFIMTGFEGPEMDKYTEHVLSAFVLRNRTIGTLTELNHYSLAFKDIGDKLVQRGQIGAKQLLQYFVRGLPIELLSTLQNSSLRDEDATFQHVLEEVQRCLQPETFFKKATLEMQRERAQIDHRAPTHGPALNLSQQGTTSKNSSSNEVVRQLEKISLNFAQAMERFGPAAFHHHALPPQGLVGNQNAAPPPFPGPARAQPYAGYNTTLSPQGNVGSAPMTTWNGPTSNNNTSYPATGPNAQPIQRPPSCVYCNDPQHARDRCPILFSHIQQGIVRLINNSVCWNDGTRIAAPTGHLQDPVMERLRQQGPPPTPASKVDAMQANYLTF
ncbi:unnamed protein product, partial [Tilletia controversa]